MRIAVRPSLRTLTLCAFTLLALVTGAVAQVPRTVSLDLNGTWKDSRGRDVTITQQGTSVSIRFASGAVFAGQLRGRRFEVKHALSFEETNKSLPTAVREQITGEEVRIVGNVSDDGSTIEGTYYDRDPDWEHDQETDAYTVKGFKPGDRPMNFFRGELKIGEVSMDYSPWYITQVELKRRLQTAKEEVRRTEEAATARAQEFERARAACVPKETALANLKRQLEAAQNTSRGTGPPEAQKSRAYKALEARINRLVARQNQLYDRITRAKEYSSNVPPQVVLNLIQEYDAGQEQEKTLRAQLKQMQDQMGYTNQVRAAAEQAVALDNAYFDAYKAYLKNELYEREMAQKRQLWAEQDREKARNELDVVQQAVDGLNAADSPNIQTIVVSVENTPRYRADVWSPDVLAQLDREVRGLQVAVRDLERIRSDARGQFLAAGDASLSATEAVRRNIWNSAITQSLIETGFNVWDIVEKGGKGGLAGALAEATKKLVEASVMGFPEFAAPQVQEEFYSFAIDDPKKVGKLLGKRLVKSNVTGPLMKTAAETSISRYLVAKEARVLAAAEKEFFTSVGWPEGAYTNVLRQRDTLEAAQERLTKAVATTSTWRSMGRDLLQNVKKGFWDAKEESFLKKSSFLTGLAKDAAKAQLKQWAADYFEGEAMVNAMQADIRLQSSVMLLLHSSRAYWEGRDLWEFKSAERTEILEQYDAKNNLRVQTNTTFRTGSRLVLTFTTLDGRADNHEFEVTVGGKRAQRSAGALTFTVTADDMQKDATGGVKLDVRVLR